MSRNSHNSSHKYSGSLNGRGQRANAKIRTGMPKVISLHKLEKILGVNMGKSKRESV